MSQDKDPFETLAKLISESTGAQKELLEKLYVMLRQRDFLILEQQKDRAAKLAGL